MAHAAGKVESIEDPPSDLDMSHARLKHDGCSGLVIFVVYDSVKTALAAVAKLHGQPLGKQTQKSAKRQKVGADDAVSERLWARQVSGEGLHLKKWRVIIRNLAFQTKPAELKAALEAGGSFVWDLSLPKNTEGSLKGFAFATFMTRGHAESGIKATNGKVVAGRQVVLDWAMAKARFTDAALQASGRQGEADAAQPADTSPADGDASPAADAALVSQDAQDTAEVSDPAAEHRMVQNVMDALLQDDDLLEGKGEAAVAPAVAPKLMKLAGAPEEAEAAGKQSTAAKSSPADGGSKEQPGKLAKGSQDTAGGGQQAGARDSSKTVFVRALPADASQDQLHLAFSKFGKLRSCRLVMNKETQQPKGTAFVEYWDTSTAQAAAAACQKAREGGAGGIMVGGRTVEVDLALSQDDARNLASGGRASAGPGGKDNRNLYLAKEGTIEEGSAAWTTMSATDRSKRKRAAEEKNTKLRSPNFSVSRTRLSVRNIPFTLQEKELKQLFIAAVKEHASKAQPRVKQAKILRDPERVDPADGLPRSRGLGFVEFTEHEHAICALRHLNNNPAPFSRDKRPVVEFALESAQAVRKMATKQAWQKSQTQGKAGAAHAHEAAATDSAHNTTGSQNTAVPASKSRTERQAAKKRPSPEDAALQSRNKKVKGLAEPTVKQIESALMPQRAAKQAGPRPKRPGKQGDGPGKQSVERKRQADTAVDQLAARSAPSTSGAQHNKGKVSKAGQSKGEKGDKLDDMISSYKAKYFGTQAQAAPAATQQLRKPAAGISRWFE
ncbi:hypothetical protein ABBQ38_003176 [Trebouxia sp. C0009 RCD-2024]